MKQVGCLVCGSSEQKVWVGFAGLTNFLRAGSLVLIFGF
jgi:hypothetical protein